MWLCHSACAWAISFSTRTSHITEMMEGSMADVPTTSSLRLKGLEHFGQSGTLATCTLSGCGGREIFSAVACAVKFFVRQFSKQLFYCVRSIYIMQDRNAHTQCMHFCALQECVCETRSAFIWVSLASLGHHSPSDQLNGPLDRSTPD